MELNSIENTYLLPKVMDSTFASRLSKDFLSFRGKPLTINGHEVERVSSQCLQVLLSAASTWNNDNQAFKIEMASEQLVNSMNMLGIESSTTLQVVQ
jgi:chemotaxis protein CheX